MSNILLPQFKNKKHVFQKQLKLRLAKVALFYEKYNSNNPAKRTRYKS